MADRDNVVRLRFSRMPYPGQEAPQDLGSTKLTRTVLSMLAPELISACVAVYEPTQTVGGAPTARVPPTGTGLHDRSEILGSMTTMLVSGVSPVLVMVMLYGTTVPADATAPEKEVLFTTVKSGRGQSVTVKHGPLKGDTVSLS